MTGLCDAAAQVIDKCCETILGDKSRFIQNRRWYIKAQRKASQRPSPGFQTGPRRLQAGTNPEVQEMITTRFGPYLLRAESPAAQPRTSALLTPISSSRSIFGSSVALEDRPSNASSSTLIRCSQPTQSGMQQSSWDEFSRLQSEPQVDFGMPAQSTFSTVPKLLSPYKRQPNTISGTQPDNIPQKLLATQPLDVWSVTRQALANTSSDPNASNAIVTEAVYGPDKNRDATEHMLWEGDFAELEDEFGLNEISSLDQVEGDW
jgi:hypothetical protein